MKRIIHIITGLNGGGAENMLYKLLKYYDKNLYYHEVISLMDKGLYGSKIEEYGIKVHCLYINREKVRIKDLLITLKRAMDIVRKFDIVDTWLYHADILGFVLAKILFRKKLIWNIRHSNLDKDANKQRTLKIIKLNSILSRYVDSITFNSNKAFENHVKAGFSNKNAIIIPNGFEFDKLKYDIAGRNNIRKELGMTNNQKIIITVGRWDIQKDYYTLLKALSEVNLYYKHFKMILCGFNLDYLNMELVSYIEDYGLKDNVILLGRRDDIPALLSAADIYVSSSLGESFSNAIGEAMACELPCVVTNVGDSKLIVGECGKVVQPKDYIGLSKAILDCLYDENIKELGKKARTRVMENYDIGEVVRLFETNFSKYI